MIGFKIHGVGDRKHNPLLVEAIVGMLSVSWKEVAGPQERTRTASISLGLCSSLQIIPTLSAFSLLCRPASSVSRGPMAEISAPAALGVTWSDAKRLGRS